MKSMLWLPTLIFSVATGEGLRSRKPRRMERNSTSNDNFVIDLADNLNDADVAATDIDTFNVTKRTRSTNGCASDQRQVTVTITTDSFGWETSWLLKGQANGVKKKSPSYESNQTYTHKFCLDIGMYQFIVKDLFNDFGGSYKVSVGNRVAVTGGDFQDVKTYLIDVGQIESVMTERDMLYLEAHNTRRMDWHSRYNTDYVPLKWSQGLKDSSMEYAIKLLDTCTTDTPRHDPNNIYGENLARNKGSGSWGQLYHPDKILNRFVEREVGLPWAKNGHLTNALWRATKYVGCAEAEKSYPVVNARGVSITNTCRVQVCRYAKPGNCSMGKFRTSDGKTDWLKAMLQDDSPCTPACPPEGCFE
ncbi:hypothetical protein HJC23_013178 [Cyclotella cryptica]|uniref:SCP domain-containing protein n=1 Tax=Cyclotella cryptica TaxID=29204 RepID=A0ABD3QNR3_9STRA|eukprot:CCRYP_003998-RA/>CCRYP_003998-RA protein AED:0.08 eAED:0.08 QI:88/1/1/1/1/1/6/706/360